MYPYLFQSKVCSISLWTIDWWPWEWRCRSVCILCILVVPQQNSWLYWSMLALAPAVAAADHSMCPVLLLLAYICGSCVWTVKSSPLYQASNSSAKPFLVSFWYLGDLLLISRRFLWWLQAAVDPCQQPITDFPSLEIRFPPSGLLDRCQVSLTLLG